METIKTVLSGFIGIRRKSDHEQAELKPLQIVVAAIVLVAIFVGTLITIVRFVVG